MRSVRSPHSLFSTPFIICGVVTPPFISTSPRPELIRLTAVFIVSSISVVGTISAPSMLIPKTSAVRFISSLQPVRIGTTSPISEALRIASRACGSAALQSTRRLGEAFPFATVKMSSIVFNIVYIRFSISKNHVYAAFPPCFAAKRASFFSAYFFVTRNSLGGFSGISNIASINTASHSERNPRAPILNSIALSTM